MRPFNIYEHPNFYSDDEDESTAASSQTAHGTQAQFNGEPWRQGFHAYLEAPLENVEQMSMVTWWGVRLSALAYRHTANHFLL